MVILDTNIILRYLLNDNNQMADEAEKIIRENSNLITKGRTVIIIAHRLSAIKDCDFIVCFDEGKIVETGTHDELVQKQGYYAGLYNARL